MNLDRLLLAPAADRPDAVALFGDDATLTWREYERASRRLAQALIAAGVQSGDRVAVSRLKSIEAYIAVHGVVRAGAVVVPIDPLAPASSAQSVLDQADVAAAILDDHTTQRLAPEQTLAGARIVIAPGHAGWDDAVAEPVDGSDPEWAERFRTTMASQPQIVGDALNEIGQKDPEIRDAVITVLETEKLLKASPRIEMLDPSVNLVKTV